MSKKANSQKKICTEMRLKSGKEIRQAREGYKSKLNACMAAVLVEPDTNRRETLMREALDLRIVTQTMNWVLGETTE